MTPIIVAGLIFACLAAVVHVYIFILESLLWTAPRTRAIFGTSEDEAATTKLLALNQGFYNLFLAIITACGIVAVTIGCTAVGAALVFGGTGSMALAAVVLAVSSPDKARAAITQGAFPLIAILLLAVGLAVRA
jgi:putative membrane protein